MVIEKHTVVQITYTLREGGEAGMVVEEVKAAKPLTFLFGVGSMLPVFENNLTGLAAGDDFQFLLDSKDAYGPVDPDAFIELPMQVFMVNGKVQSELLFPGNVITLSDDQGRKHRAKVLGVTETQVKVDFNHPMAGKDLHFTGKVETIRDATPSEIDHGHPHGPGGVNH